MSDVEVAFEFQNYHASDHRVLIHCGMEEVIFIPEVRQLAYTFSFNYMGPVEVSKVT